MMMQYSTTSNAYKIETVYTYEEWEKEYRRNKAIERKQKVETIGQKCLGLGLLALGIIGCCIFPEDAGGFVFTSVLGILRVIY